MIRLDAAERRTKPLTSHSARREAFVLVVHAGRPPSTWVAASTASATEAIAIGGALFRDAFGFEPEIVLDWTTDGEELLNGAIVKLLVPHIPCRMVVHHVLPLRSDLSASITTAVNGAEHVVVGEDLVSPS